MYEKKNNRRHYSSSNNNNRREETRYRGSRHYNGTFTDDDNEYNDENRKIQLLGFTLSNPLLYFRKQLPSFIRVTNPVMMLVVLGIVMCIILFVILTSIFDYTLHDIWSSVHSTLFPFLQQGDDEDDNNGIVGAALPHVTSDGKFHGRYPNSLLTLFYPLTLYADVVLDQPVDPSDVPFFWHPHVSDEIAVKAVLTQCYGAEIVELNSIHDIEMARNNNLIPTLVTKGRIGQEAIVQDGLYGGQRHHPLIIASPHIRAAAELFSQDNFGRTFAFYRHPIDYDIHPELRPTLPLEALSNNFLTRLLSNVHTGALGYKELGMAKQIIRQTTIAGTRDLMSESLFRFGKYHGWVPVGGQGTKESIIDDDNIAQTCINDAIKDIPGELYADHDSPEWHTFYNANKLDCELYEIARSTWRAQIQTIIPLTLQKRRAGEGDDDEEDKEEDEDEE
jgi:hypothetical protein